MNVGAGGNGAEVSRASRPMKELMPAKELRASGSEETAPDRTQPGDRSLGLLSSSSVVSTSSATPPPLFVDCLGPGSESASDSIASLHFGLSQGCCLKTLCKVQYSQRLGIQHLCTGADSNDQELHWVHWHGLRRPWDLVALD